MPEKERPDYSDKNEVREFTQVAKEVFGLKFGKGVQSGVQANFVGIKSGLISFSQRLDSRTYFIQDARYGTDRKAGVYRGSDREYIQACRGLLKRLRIPLSEIANADLLKEQTQAAFIDRERKTVQTEEAQQGKWIVRLSRNIEILPVWSSSMLMGLTKDRQIGYLQLHWPEIPAHIVHEAHRLDYGIKHKWRPPEQPGATVEAIEAGIIHSPAIGFLMDIYPVIRVIYGEKEQKVGKKTVLYLDRNGRPVPIPRQSELPIELPQERISSEKKEPLS